MKVQCPKDTCSVSIGGEEFPVDEKGQIELPDTGNHFSLLPAGFTVVSDDKKAVAPAAEQEPAQS